MGDKDIMKKFEVVQEIEGEARQVINNFLDMAIRDYKAKKAYPYDSSCFQFITYLYIYAVIDCSLRLISIWL